MALLQKYHPYNEYKSLILEPSFFYDELFLMSDNSFVRKLPTAFLRREILKIIMARCKRCETKVAKPAISSPFYGL